MKVKKAFAFLLCAAWGVTVSPAEAGSSFLQDDVRDDPATGCLLVAQSQEPNQQDLIQCLQNASLETLGKMDWYGSPLWKMGQYIFEHPELKTLYEDRLKPLCDAYMVSVFQNPSLEQLATVTYRWHSPYVATCLVGDTLLKYDAYLAQALETFSFAHLRETGDLAAPLFALRDHLCQNPALRSQYKQHVLNLLQHASLEEIASLHVDTPSKHLGTHGYTPWYYVDSFFLINPRERLVYPHNLRVAQLLQDISFPDVLRMHNEESSLWGLGQHILGSGDLKNHHSHRMAQVIASLSFAELLDLCDPFLSQVKDYIYDHPTLNTLYTQRIKDMLQGFSVKEIGSLHWPTPSKKVGTTRSYIPWHELGYLGLTEARDTRVMHLLQDISFSDFLSIQHVLKSPSLKNANDKKFIDFLTKLSFDTWRELGNGKLLDLHYDYLLKEAPLKEVYTQSFLAMLPHLSLEQLKEFHQWEMGYFWIYFLSWMENPDFEKAYKSHVAEVLKNLSLADLASVKGWEAYGLNSYMGYDEDIKKESPALKTLNEIYYETLAKALQESSYGEVSALMESIQGFREFLTADPVLSTLYESLS